jgi:HTH-type transcriptional regulator/antitoxin HigA
MGRPNQAISQIIRGKKQITPSTALQMAAVFGTSAKFWINLETNYQLYQEQENFDHSEISHRSKLYGIAPVADLMKRHWIEPCSSLEDLEQQICGFLEIESLDEQPSIMASFRHGTFRDPEVMSQVAWVQRVRQLAREQTVAEFDLEKASESLSDLLALCIRKEGVSQVPIVLRDMGIHFVIVPHLPGTYLDGAAVRDNGRQIVAMTVRHNRIDNFWFTLLHEIAHIIAEHPSRLYLDNHDELPADDVEREANQKARNWLIDPDLLEDFVHTTKPYFSRQKLLFFAEQIKRHPGIVLGRLHHDGEVPHKNLRSWLVKIRPFFESWIDGPGPQA